MSLTSCLAKAGNAINAEDRAAIIQAAASLRKGGMANAAAAIKAVEDRQAFVQAELTKRMAAPVESATHKDPGEPAEPVTPDVVHEAIATAIAKTDRKPSEMKAQLLAEVDQAVKDAPDYGDFQEGVKSLGLKDATALYTDAKGRLGDKSAPAGHSRPTRTFHIQGDGIFTVNNTVRQLLTFRAKVESSPGFKDRQTIKAPEKSNSSADYGPDQLARSMLDEGEPANAVAALEASGRPMMFGNGRDAAPIPYTNAEPITIKDVSGFVGRGWSDKKGDTSWWSFIHLKSGFQLGKGQATRAAAIAEATKILADDAKRQHLLDLEKSGKSVNGDPFKSQDDLREQFIDEAEKKQDATFASADAAQARIQEMQAKERERDAFYAGIMGDKAKRPNSTEWNSAKLDEFLNAAHKKAKTREAIEWIHSQLDPDIHTWVDKAIKSWQRIGSHNVLSFAHTDIKLPSPPHEMTFDEILPSIIAHTYVPAGVSARERILRPWKDTHFAAAKAVIDRGGSLPDKVLYAYPSLIRSDLSDDDADLASDAMSKVFAKDNPIQRGGPNDYAGAVKAYREWAKPQATPTAKAEAILAAAAEPPKGKDRLEVLKDVKAGTVTPEEVQAAYPPKEEPPQFTEAQARKQFEWRDLGQKSGVKTHGLFFFTELKDKGTGAAMSRGQVTRYEGSDGWQVDGEGQKYPGLADAKAAAIEAAIPVLREQGWIKADRSSPAAEGSSLPKVTAEAAPVAAKEAKPGAVENFGEALPPPRRTLAAKLSEDLSDDDIANKPLGEIWPQSENEAITDKYAAAVAFAARDEVPAKPRNQWKLDRWVESVKTVRKLAHFIVSGQATREQFIEKAGKSYSMQKFLSKVALLDSIDRSQWKRIGNVQESPDAYSFGEGGTKIPAPQVSVEIDGKSHRLTGSGSLADHMDAINKLLGQEAQDKKMAFEVRGSGNKFFINKKGDSEYRHLMDFTSSTEALKAVRERYEDLVKAWDSVKDRDNVTERDLRSDENKDRAGPDYRNGRDIDADEFASTFGFRGGEFGSWVSQGKGDKERQWMLNRAYDAFMDLANLVGIPPSAISLNGTLGMAFGSRGTGWAAAHFEPGNLVINLTKTKGAGSLAHEWLHALDNYFSRLRGGEVPFTGDRQGYRSNNYITYKPEPMLVRKDGRGVPIAKGALENLRERHPTSPLYAADNWKPDPKHRLGVRPEVEEKFADLVKALNDSPMTKRSALIDKGKSNGYWSQIIERAARSFETYVIYRLAEKGEHNDYLANVTPVEVFRRDASRYPYPTPAEIKPIAEAFDNLFGTIQVKQGEDGKVSMFSRAPDIKEALDAAIAAKEAFDAMDRKSVKVDDAQDYFDLSAAFSNAKEALAKELAKQPDDGFALQGLTRDGRMLILNASAQNQGQWQLTRFDRSGEPWGESQYSTKASALSDFLREVNLDSLRDMGGAFSRGRGAGLHLNEVDAVIAAIEAANPTAPKIIPLDSVNKAPDKLLADIRKVGAQNDVEAAYHEGKVYVFYKNIASVDRALFVVGHHELRHHGLRSMFGDGDRFKRLMLSMGMSNPALKAAAKAKQDAGHAGDFITAVEEALADMPVEELTKLSGWDKIVAAIRQWARRVAEGLRKSHPTLADLIQPEKWTDADVASMVIQAEGISRGGSAPYKAGGTAFGRDTSNAVSHSVKTHFGTLAKVFGNPLTKAFRENRKALDAGQITEDEWRTRQNSAASSLLDEVVRRFGDKEVAERMFRGMDMRRNDPALFYYVDRFIQDHLELAIKSGMSAQNFGVLMTSLAGSFSSRNGALQIMGQRFDPEAQEAAKQMLAAFAGAIGYKTGPAPKGPLAIAGTKAIEGPKFSRDKTIPASTDTRRYQNLNWEQTSDDMQTAEVGNGWTAAIYQNEDGTVELSVLDPRGVDFGDPVTYKHLGEARLAAPGILARRITENGTQPGDDTAIKGSMFSRAPTTASAPGQPTQRQLIGDSIRKAGGGAKLVGQTARKYTEAQLAAFRNVGFEVQAPTLEQRAKALWKDAGKKLAQGLVDQFAPVKDISAKAYGLLRLSKGASGAFEALLQGGQLKLTDGVYDFDEQKRGGVLDALLKPLGGEHHDFFRWIAANRAERLMSKGKENLFTVADITALKSLSNGNTDFGYVLQHGDRAGQKTNNRAQVYADALQTFNQFNTNVLDMAEQSGLIDGEARKLWENEFYVPFYRVEEDGTVAGADIKNGAVRQQAFKSLTGRKEKLHADLLDNTLMNWAHLLDAAAKNRAAKASIEAAESMGAAGQIEAHEGPGSVWFRENGAKRWSMVNDPYLLTAITALEYQGAQSPAMRVMGSFKRALTIGVTASPFFKVRNLIRDSVQAIGTSPLGYNPVANIAEGWKLTDPKSDAYFRLLAGGGTIHFGTMMEGSEAKRVQALVESGVDQSTILNSEQKVKAFYRKFIEPGITAYNELGNRGEAVNRAALYKQLRAQGMSHAEASLQARDLMDFSMQGSYASVRFLTQVVPFFNARIQGLYKLGRAAKDDPQRFATVIGAAAMLSVGLVMAFGDDDDWKKREDWDRNNYWWFKVAGVAFRIPKPFEIGAVATLAERGFELAFDKEMTGARFRQQVLTLLGDNLSMNPIPQLVKPMLDVYANKDSFTGRPIETQGMEKLKSEYRFGAGTSMAARAMSTSANAVTGLVGADALSPVQVEHLLRGYFGWLGSFVIGAGDVLARPAAGEPGRPAADLWKEATGGMVSDLRDAPSRYVSQMYQQATVIEQAYATWRELLKEGKVAEASEFFQGNQQTITKYGAIEAAKRMEGKLNQQVRAVERSNATPDEKRERIRSLIATKDRVSRTLAPA